jgi:3-hydroxy acid dehydrogenase / malonic semialdehyde reductase
MTTFKGRTYIVTGSSRGIGKALCHHLLAQEARVVGIARQASSWQKAGYVPFDLDLADLKKADILLRNLAHKEKKIDGVISNAGSGRFGGLESFSLAQIRSAIDLNLTSHLLVAHSFVPHLKRQGCGDVVFIGSEAALQGRRQGVVYCAAKFGLRGAAQALREECSRQGVRVSIIHPGMVRSSFFDDLHFSPGDKRDEAIEVNDVVDAIMSVLNARPGTVIDEISLSPQKKVIVHSGS